MNIIELHIEEFGVEPFFIGAAWLDVDDKILEAIKNGVPYDERQQLPRDLLAQFDAGEILF